MSSVEELLNLLIANNYSISSCESFTGGMFANEITNIANASKVYKGSIISYQNEIKENVVGVNSETLNTVGAISYECAQQMAKNTKKLFNSDICVSFTGNAGPNPSEDKEVGLVYMGLAFDDELIVYKLNFEGSRHEIKEKSINFICERLIQKIKEKEQNEDIII